MALAVALPTAPETAWTSGGNVEVIIQVFRVTR